MDAPASAISCPNCGAELQSQRSPYGVRYVCPGCDGRAINLADLRMVGGDRLVNDLLRQMNRKERITPRACPFCQQWLVTLRVPENQLELDGCHSCRTVWFDGAELEQLSINPPLSTDELRLRAQEQLALEKIAAQREADPAPDTDWKAIPAALGLPVESDAEELQRTPWLTWGMAVLIAAVSTWGFLHEETALRRFGFVPSQAWSLGGLTMVTSFFLHGGIWHLLSNLYFLMVFGDNVEDDLGPWRFLILCWLAAVSGDLLHWAGDPHATLPCIGASGGISGILAYYALQFPHRRLSFGWGLRFGFFRWIKLPAAAAFILWLALQLWIAVQQVSGFGHVSALAHLGGVMTGVAFWLLWRRTSARRANGACGRPGEAAP